MNLQPLRFSIMACLLACVAANSAWAVDREEALQSAFEKFPLLTPATNASGQPQFQELFLTNPVVINSNNFYGFRFTVPDRQNDEDLALAFVKPADNFMWYILPETGGMAGFTEYHPEFRDDYEGTEHFQPPHRPQLYLQSLPGENLNDGETYLFWMRIPGKRTTMSLVFTFTELDPYDESGRHIAKAFHLKRLPISQPLSPPGQSGKPAHLRVVASG